MCILMCMACALHVQVAYFLPRNTGQAQIARLAREAGVPVEVEALKLNGHLKGLMAYFGFVD